MRATWKRIGNLASRVTRFRRRGKDRSRSPSPDDQPDDDLGDGDRQSISSWRSSQAGDGGGDDETGQVVNCEGVLGVVKGDEVLPRYFVLTDEKLKYYSSEDQYAHREKPRGFIPLNQVLNVDFTERGVLVSLKGQADPLELVPNQIEEVEKWLLSFAEALEHVQAEPEHERSSEISAQGRDSRPELKHSPTLFGEPRNERGATSPSAAASGQASKERSTSPSQDKEQEASEGAEKGSEKGGTAAATEYRGPFQLLRRMQKKDGKDAKEAKEAKEAKQAKEAKEAQGAKDSKDRQDSKRSQEKADLGQGAARSSGGARASSDPTRAESSGAGLEVGSGVGGIRASTDDGEDLPPLVGETPSQRTRSTALAKAAAARAAVARAEEVRAAGQTAAPSGQAGGAPARPQGVVAAARAAAEAAAAKASEATVGVVPFMLEDVPEDVEILQQGPLLSVLSATEEPNLRYFLLTPEALWYYDEFLHLEIGEAPRGAIELDRILRFEEGENGFTFTLNHQGDIQLVQFQVIGEEDPRVWAANFRRLLEPRLQEDYEKFWQSEEEDSESDPEANLEREILLRGAAASSFRVWLQVELAEGLPLSNFHPNRYLVRAAWENLPKSACETYAVLGSQRIGKDTEECHLHQQLVLKAAAGQANVLVTLVMKQTPQDGLAHPSTAKGNINLRSGARRTEVGRPFETDLGRCLLSPSDPESGQPQTYELLDADGQVTGAKLRARLRITAVPVTAGLNKDIRTFNFQVELPIGVHTENLGARFLNLRGQGQRMGYMFTSLITPGSWAELEGLQQGDELEEIGGLKVGDMTREDFAAALELRPVMLTFSRKQSNQDFHGDSEVAPAPFWEVSGDGWDQHFYNFSSNHLATNEDISLGSQQAKTQSMVSLTMKVQNLSYALLSVNPVALQALRSAVKASISKIAGHGVQEQHVSVRLASGMPAVVRATVAAAPPHRATGVRELLSSNRSMLGKDLVEALAKVSEVAALAMGPLSVTSFLGRSEELNRCTDGPTDVFSKLHNMHQERTQERQRLKMMQTMKEDEIIERNKVGKKKKGSGLKKGSNAKAISERLFYDSKLKGERQQILRAKHHFEEAQAVEETRTRPRLLESTLQSHEAALVAQAAGTRLHAMHQTHVETLRLKKVAADAKTYAEMEGWNPFTAATAQREPSRPLVETCHDLLFEDARERWERGQMAQEDEASKGLRTLEKVEKKKKVPDMGRVLQWQEQAKQRGEQRRRMLLEKEAAVQRKLEQECAEQKELFLCPDYLRHIPSKVKTMSVSTPSTRRPQTSATTTATTTASASAVGSQRGRNRDGGQEVGAEASERPESQPPSQSRDGERGRQASPHYPSAAESASLLRERGLSAQLPALPASTIAKAKPGAAARQGARGKASIAQIQQLQQPKASALQNSPKRGAAKPDRARGRSLTTRVRPPDPPVGRASDPGSVTQRRNASRTGAKKSDVAIAFGSVHKKPPKSETPSAKATKAINGKVGHIMATLHANISQRCGVEVKEVSISVARELAAPLTRALQEFQNAAQASDQKGYGAQALRSRGSQRLWNDGFLLRNEDGKATCKEPDPIRQPDSDLQRLLEAGRIAQGYLEMKVGKSNGSERPEGPQRFSKPSLTGALFAVSKGPKGEEEVEVESFVRYGPLGRTGRFQHILDFARLVVVFPDASSLEGGLDEILQMFDVVEVRNFYESGAQGMLGNRYVQVHIVLTELELGRGTHVAELLLQELCFHEAQLRSEASINELAESLCFMYQQPGIGVSVLQHLVRWLLERPKEDHTLTIFRRNLARNYGSIATAWRTLGLGSTVPFKAFRKLCEAVGCRPHVVGYWEALDAGRAGNISLFELDPDAVSLLARFLSALLAGYAEKAKCSMQDARNAAPEALMQWLLSKARRKPERKQQMVAAEWRSAAKALGFSAEEGDRLFSYLLPDAHAEKRISEAIGPDDLCYLAQIEQIVDLDAVFLRTVSGERGPEDRSSLFVSTWAVHPSSTQPHLAMGAVKGEERGPSHGPPSPAQRPSSPSPTRGATSALPRELHWRQRVGESLAGSKKSPRTPQRGDRVTSWIRETSPKSRSESPREKDPADQTEDEDEHNEASKEVAKRAETGSKLPFGKEDLGQFFETGKIPGVYSSDSSFPMPFPFPAPAPEIGGDGEFVGEDARSVPDFDSDLVEFFEHGAQARLEVIRSLDRHRRVDSPEAEALRSVLQKEADARFEVLKQQRRPNSRDRPPKSPPLSNSPPRLSSTKEKRNGERPAESWKELFSGSDLESEIY